MQAEAKALDSGSVSQSLSTRSAAGGRSGGWIGWLFALPHLILFFVFLLGPTVYGFFISLREWHVLAKQHPFVGLANYQAALSDDIFWIALRNTAYFVFLVVPLGNLVSLLLALGLGQVRRLQTFYKVAFYMPVVISIAVVAVLWQWLYNTQVGLLNLYLGTMVNGLRQLGLPLSAFQPIPWLSDPHWTMPSIALMSIWWGAGGNMILYLAGINNIPPDYYEAARIDGANAWQVFKSITWPLLRPTTLFCLVFSVLGAFQIFGQSYVLYGGGAGPGRAGLTLVLYMYQQGFSQYEIGYGAAIAYLLFAIVLAFTAVQFRLLSNREESRS
ncbi:MAG: sugar ABC transporter permease [Abitibacteriaceae bacterium]|nr:sugar ABC transporter permease [Abditibacteriaceae bacterium]